jgi:hypothetical protein
MNTRWAVRHVIFTIITMLSLGLLTLLALTTEAAPTIHRLAKRHSDCWGSNLQGCSYSTAGYSGAAVSVSLSWRYPLTGRKSVPAPLSVWIYLPKEEMLLMVRRSETCANS